MTINKENTNDENAFNNDEENERSSSGTQARGAGLNEASLADIHEFFTDNDIGFGHFEMGEF